jgi:hypothetical protein
MKTRPSLLAAITFAALLSLAGTAHADIPRPEREVCTGKQAGAACTYGSVSGSCRTAKCNQRVMVMTDAGLAWDTKDVDCLTCQSGSAAAADGGTTGAKDDDSGCSVGRRGGARAVGPWLLAGLSSLLFLRRRRQA